MPSHRKRIGFLPSEEVQEIIEKICSENKCSQSKVTGILVEEALRSRGILKNNFKEFSKYSNRKLNNSRNKNNLNNDLNNNVEFYNLNKKNLKEDLKMINEFIEFKFFKKVMNQNDNILD